MINEARYPLARYLAFLLC